MAYNQFFPQSYQPYGNFNPYQQIIPQSNPNYPQSQQIIPQSGQIQNGGFISVRSIEEAYNYPVAPGNSITFKDENSPYVYTKTKGFSQLDPPVFEKYRLVKEEEQSHNQTSAEPHETPVQAKNYDDEIKALWDEIDVLKGQITAQRTPVKKQTKKEAESDESTDGK